MLLGLRWDEQVVCLLLMRHGGYCLARWDHGGHKLHDQSLGGPSPTYPLQRFKGVRAAPT